MLVFGDEDPPGFLEQLFVVPMRVEVVEVIGQPVVFSQKDDLEDRELGILVSTNITCKSDNN